MSKDWGLKWTEHGRQDPKKILGIPSKAYGVLDRIYREAKVGNLKIRQSQVLRTSKDQEPYPVGPGGAEGFWIYGPGTRGKSSWLLCIVEPNRLDEFLELLK